MALICHCEDVKKRTINAAIRAGACDLDDVAAVCGAGSRCGGCQPAIVELLIRNAAAAPAVTDRLTVASIATA